MLELGGQLEAQKLVCGPGPICRPTHPEGGGGGGWHKALEGGGGVPLSNGLGRTDTEPIGEMAQSRMKPERRAQWAMRGLCGALTNTPLHCTPMGMPTRAQTHAPHHLVQCSTLRGMDGGNDDWAPEE